VAAGHDQLEQAVQRLRRGELVGFPTETVYGLGARAFDARAVRRVFELKGRSPANPLIVHVSDAEMAKRVCREWSSQAAQLAEAFWPGPLSIVASKRPELPHEVTGGQDTVCVRAPGHPLALALIESLAEPIVGPSANRSGHVSPTRAAHVEAEFPGLFVLDGGACRIGIESTVVRVGMGRAEVLRPGAITPAQIESVLGRHVSVREHRAGDSPVSPGLVGKHYAPRTPTVLIDENEAVAACTRACVVVSQHRRAGLAGEWIEMPRHAEEYAAALYDALRRADAMGKDRILIVAPSGPGDAEMWAAILDRLMRASMTEPGAA